MLDMYESRRNDKLFESAANQVWYSHYQKVRVVSKSQWSTKLGSEFNVKLMVNETHIVDLTWNIEKFKSDKCLTEMFKIGMVNEFKRLDIGQFRDYCLSVKYADKSERVSLPFPTLSEMEDEWIALESHGHTVDRVVKAYRDASLYNTQPE